MAPGTETRELRIFGPTLEDVLAQVARHFSGLVQRDPDATPDRLPMLLRAADPEQLLHRFVEDLLHLAREERFAATRLERFSLQDGELRAALSGWSGAIMPLVARIVGSELRRDVSRGCWQARVWLV